MSDLNPYAPPTILAGATRLDESLRYFSDGKFLVVRDGAELPELCMLTNQPAGPGAWRKKVQIAWTPPWVFALILVNIIVVLVVMLLTQKKAKITYSLSAAGRGRIVRRRIIGLLLLAAAVGAVAFCILQADVPDWASVTIGLLGVVSFIASLIVLLMANPIKALKHKDGWFRIKGCSGEFLSTLPQHDSPF